MLLQSHTGEIVCSRPACAGNMSVKDYGPGRVEVDIVGSLAG
jgi:hypothetical protein